MSAEGRVGSFDESRLMERGAQSWTALFRAFSSHRQPSASLTKLFPSESRYDFPGVDHEGRQTFRKEERPWARIENLLSL